jgi:16S rRNA G966 N2-methylase RsmD
MLMMGAGSAAKRALSTKSNPYTVLSTDQHATWHNNKHVPHSRHATWNYEGGHVARQARMRLVGIDQLLHEEKDANYFAGGTLPLSDDEKRKIKLDEVAYFSLCPKTHADQITEAIASLSCLVSHDTEAKPTITDACAGVGGVSMSLVMSDNFATVNSVEYDVNRAALLTNNLQAIRRNGNDTESRVTQRSYLDVMHSLEQDVVFFDPPFGGPGYKYYENAVLFLGKTHLATIANDLLMQDRAKYVVLRAPENFDLQYFVQCLHTQICCKELLNLDRTLVYAFSKTH